MTSSTQSIDKTGRGGWRKGVWGTAAVLLLIPAIAMQFTTEVNWGPEDFLFAGVMLLIACGIYEAATRMTGNRYYRLGVAIAVLAGFSLIWINLAVGIIGNEGNPLNLMYGGVVLVAVLASLAARFRPAGMALAMTVTAVAEGVVAAVAQAFGHFTWAQAAVWCGLWLVSAALFRRAAEYV